MIGATDVEPRNPEQFARDLAAGVNTLLENPAVRAVMAKKARRRVKEHFSWTSIARQTLDFYQTLIGPRPTG